MIASKILITRIPRSAVVDRRSSVQPWTPTVHAFLRHLEAEGFPAAPRVIGSGFDDAGNEILSWIWPYRVGIHWPGRPGG
jgi:hypothetical protein